MRHPSNSLRSFDLKLVPPFCFCNGCVKIAQKIVLNIEGVRSIHIDTEKGVATISGKVHRHKVIEEFIEKFEKKTKKKIKVKLVVKQNDPSKVSEQKPQIGLSQNLPSTSHSVSLQPPDLSFEVGNGNPEHEHKMEVKSHTKLFKCDGCKHNMELKDHTKPFKCDGCREDGYGKRYRCEPCNRELHEVCMFREPNIIHELFERRTFAFSQKPGNICDACGLKIHGYSYSCKKDELDLHPCCSKLRGKLRIGDIDFVLRKKVKGKCFCCEKKQHSHVKDDEVSGWCYVSDSKQYKIYCHVYCVSEIMCEAWKTGQLDRKDKVDDKFMVLEKLDLEKLGMKLSDRLERSGGGVGTKIFKIGVALLRIVISTLLGDPTGLALSVAELIIQ